MSVAIQARERMIVKRRVHYYSRKRKSSVIVSRDEELMYLILYSCLIFGVNSITPYISGALLICPCSLSDRLMLTEMEAVCLNLKKIQHSK